ncbi:MAG: TrmB family transcriptional regulator [Candidatus Bathyarchaeota archaeon]|nr:MAG: TrmB family transcriptional regulator [Candidatus Bathyarchaeota archaeon]
MNHAVGENTKRFLHELGLTAYESVVYLSLIEHGVMTASKVSESASVPFSKVYEVLNNLERKGWLDIERGRPSRYFAKSPTEAFEGVKRNLDEKVQSWKKTMVDELQPLYEKRELREKPDIWILRGEASVLTKLREMLSKAHLQVMIAAPLFARTLAEKTMPLLSSFKLDGVDVSVLVAGSLKDWGLDIIQGLDVRERADMFGGGVIVDGKEAMLFLGEEDKPNLVVWSNHVGLVKFAKDYFQYLWKTSKEVSRP